MGAWRRKSHLQETLLEWQMLVGREYMYFHLSSLGIHRISSTSCLKITSASGQQAKP